MLVLSDSLVQYSPASVKLEHGRVNVVTSKGFAVRVGIKISPAAESKASEFEVSDTNGSARIIARKGGLTLVDGDNTTTIPEGRETAREDNSSKNRRNGGAGAVPGAGGGILNSPVAIGMGSGAIIAWGAWVLTRNDDPESPDHP